MRDLNAKIKDYFGTLVSTRQRIITDTKNSDVFYINWEITNNETSEVFSRQKIKRKQKCGGSNLNVAQVK